MSQQTESSVASDTPDFFAEDALREARVAIVGLGLIGGSLALALKGRCALLLAADPDPRTRALAMERGVVDVISPEAAAVVPQADVVVLAAPVRTILHLLDELPALHPGRAVVMDVGSTKKEIVDRMATLPERFDPIGGHPMAGKEKGGLCHAEATLFRGAVFALTPLSRTSARARRVASALVAAVGAFPLWLNADTHDQYAAAISHAPYLLSLALTLATPEEAAVLAGPGFRSTTRLASSPPGVMADILLTNRAWVLKALRGFRGQLAAIEAALASGDEAALRALLAQGPVRREALLAGGR